MSEIILQQTRVAQGLPYYQEFTEIFPTVHDLANANEESVLRVWQGLGYYSRARNLHKCAKIVSHVLNGQFPQKYDDLLKLPGIGPYTAAAIASFAFNAPQAVVDGNVYRVLARIFGIDKDISTGKGQRYFREVANQLISRDSPGEYNQAIMEFGALHCTPSKPRCSECIFNLECYARQHGKQSELPVKSKKGSVSRRYLHYLVVQHEEKLFMKPRTEKDIWQGLYDFPLLETATGIPEAEITASFKEVFQLPGGFTLTSISQNYRHLLSHQQLEVKFYIVDTGNQPPQFDDPSIRPYDPQEIDNLPKPVLISRYLNEYIF